MMYGMADWFLKGGEENDQTRLSRILDVAQDLKALSMLLNISQFSFVVELACLASRREYLKLDKWLSDKIRDHGVSTSSFRRLIGHSVYYLFSGYFCKEILL